MVLISFYIPSSNMMMSYHPTGGLNPPPPATNTRSSSASTRGPNSSGGSGSGRRKREFTPSEKKDASYWDKRRKNNEAAKRSREKRRLNDLVLETRVLGLLDENARLKAELLALKFRFGLDTWCLTDLVSHRLGASQTWCLTDFVSHRLGASQTWCLTDLVPHRLGVSQTWCLTDLVSHRLESQVSQASETLQVTQGFQVSVLSRVPKVSQEPTFSRQSQVRQESCISRCPREGRLPKVSQDSQVYQTHVSQFPEVSHNLDDSHSSPGSQVPKLSQSSQKSGSQRSLASSASGRRKREFTPSEKKDASYWDKRRKNNEAAKRSREKRRLNDLVLETRVLGLLDENARLKTELISLRLRCGLLHGEDVKSPSPVRPSMPQHYDHQQDNSHDQQHHPYDKNQHRNKQEDAARLYDRVRGWNPWTGDRQSPEVGGLGGGGEGSPTTRAIEGACQGNSTPEAKRGRWEEHADGEKKSVGGETEDISPEIWTSVILNGLGGVRGQREWIEKTDKCAERFYNWSVEKPNIRCCAEMADTHKERKWNLEGNSPGKRRWSTESNNHGGKHSGGAKYGHNDEDLPWSDSMTSQDCNGDDNHPHGFVMDRADDAPSSRPWPETPRSALPHKLRLKVSRPSLGEADAQASRTSPQKRQSIIEGAVAAGGRFGITSTGDVDRRHREP
ncbi:unnamed protein product [Lampetra planeri]